MKTALTAASRLVGGIVMFVGLPLAGWCLGGDMQGFVHHPARLSYVVLITLLSIILVVFFPGVGTSRCPGKKLVSRQRLALMLVQLLSTGIVFLGPYCDHRQIAVLSESELLRYVGLALVFLGFVGMTWAAVLLGKQFSVQVTIQEGHKLITHGLYCHLRHPRYLSGIIFMVGIALVFRCWASLLLVLALTIVLLWRIHDEETLLHQEFGASWEAYVQKSWRLIPLIY